MLCAFVTECWQHIFVQAGDGARPQHRSAAASAALWRRRCDGPSPFKSMSWFGWIFPLGILNTAQPAEHLLGQWFGFKDQGSSRAKYWSSSLVSQSLVSYQSLRYLQKLMLNLSKKKSCFSIHLVFHAMSFVLLCCRLFQSFLNAQGQLWLWVSAAQSTMHHFI